MLSSLCGRRSDRPSPTRSAEHWTGHRTQVKASCDASTRLRKPQLANSASAARSRRPPSNHRSSAPVCVLPGRGASTDGKHSWPRGSARTDGGKTRSHRPRRQPSPSSRVHCSSLAWRATETLPLRQARCTRPSRRAICREPELILGRGLKFDRHSVRGGCVRQERCMRGTASLDSRTQVWFDAFEIRSFEERRLSACPRPRLPASATSRSRCRRAIHVQTAFESTTLERSGTEHR